LSRFNLIGIVHYNRDGWTLATTILIEGKEYFLDTPLELALKTSNYALFKRD
jgi:hypothetical protein